MKNLLIKIRDINKLSSTTVVSILTRLSWENSKSSSSIKKELTKRYVNPTPAPHANMAMALIFIDDFLVGWVGTRPWVEKFKGESVTAQTVECFIDADFRRRGLAKLGLQALISAGKLDRDGFVAVYAPEVVNIAKSCNCKTVLLCES